MFAIQCAALLAHRNCCLCTAQGTVTVALDAGEPARWMLNCQHMPLSHLSTGMMTEFAVSS